MAQATVTKEEVLGFLKSFQEKQEETAKAVAEQSKVVTDLVEKSKQSGSGVNARNLRDYMQDGIAFFGPNGAPIDMRRVRSGRRHKSLEMDREGGERGTFGNWLANLTAAGDPRVDQETRGKAFMVCKSYGTQQYKKPLGADTYGPEEYIAKTALAESSAIAGGYTLLPTEFSNQLYEIQIEENIVEKRAHKQPLNTRQSTIPALDQVNETFTPIAGQSNLLAGLNLTWVAEAALRKESEPQFRNVVGTAWEGSFYALVSNNLLADNAVGLEAYLPDLFRQVVGWGRDYAFLQGNGVGQPLGVLNCNATIQFTRAGGAGTQTLAYGDICNMEAKLYTPNRGNSGICWIIHPTVKPLLTQLNDGSGTTAGTGRLVFQPIDQGAQAAIDAPEGMQSYGRLLNYPVFVSEKVPALGNTGDVGLYDFSGYAVFQRMEIEIMVSPVVAMLNNQTAYRIVTRCDGQPMIGNPITYADNGSKSKASFFVALK